MKKVTRRHYKKDKKSQGLFDELLATIFRDMGTDPTQLKRARTEPWPSGLVLDGFVLMKLRFNMPGLRGESGQGRLIYTLHDSSRVAIPLIMYTHSEHKGRPPSKSLKELLGDAPNVVLAVGAALTSDN